MDRTSFSSQHVPMVASFVSRISATSSAVAVACTLVLVAASTGGCSSVKSFGELFGGKSGSPGKGTFYAGANDLKLYSKPSYSSSTIGSLALHQKVYRAKIEKGFAYVKVATTGQHGWVENGKLLWRLPSSADEAATPRAEPDVTESASQPVSAEAPAAPAPAQQTTPESDEAGDEQQGTDPSLFNPF